MTGDRPPGLGIDWPAKADADGPRLVTLDHLAAHGLNLAEDPPCPVFQADLRAAEVGERRAVAGTNGQLQFRAADLDAEIHGHRPLSSSSR